jgi:hypothetical protein
MGPLPLTAREVRVRRERERESRVVAGGDNGSRLCNFCLEREVGERWRERIVRRSWGSGLGRQTSELRFHSLFYVMKSITSLDGLPRLGLLYIGGSFKRSADLLRGATP